MSLHRTPPKTPTLPESETESGTCTQTQTLIKKPTPNPVVPENKRNVNVTTRNRKPVVKSDDDYSTFMNEIRDMLRSHTAQMDSKLESLQNTIKEISTQNTEIKEKLTTLTKQYDDIVIRTEKLEAERKSDFNYIIQLEDRIENLERMSCLSKLEIRNILKPPGESKEDLHKIVTEMATVLGVSIQRHEIKDLFRLNRKEGVSPIIVDFTNMHTKGDFIKSARNFNKKNKENKLNTSHIKLEGPPKPVFVSECLTPKAQRLFYLARKFAKENNYMFCWTSLGKVFLKKIEEEKQILIRSEADLDLLHQTQ